MRNKIIFTLLALLVFAAALIGAYAGLPAFEKYRADRERADFVRPDVPEEIVLNFSREFYSLMASTEPMRLPDDAFLDLGGQERRFSDFAGKPTLVNFWATWCTPCVVELPLLDKLAKHYEGRMNVVGVALEPDMKPSEIAVFLEKRLIQNFAGHVDMGGAIGAALELRGLPTSFLLGSDGLILYRFDGDADWTSEESKAFFDALLLQKR